MIWIVLGVILGIVVEIREARENGECWGAYLLGTIGIGFLLGSALNLGVGLLIDSETTVSKTEVTMLVAMQDTLGLKVSSTFLGGVTINSIGYYLYYEKLSNNSYRLGKIKSEYCIIIEDDNIAPQINKLYYNWENKWWNWLGFCGRDSTFVFIPKGSITQNFRLDLK